MYSLNLMLNIYAYMYSPILKFSLVQVDKYLEVSDHLDHTGLPTEIPSQPGCRCLAARLVKEPCKGQPHLVLGQN